MSDLGGPSMQDGQAALTSTPKASTGVYVGTVWEEYQIVMDRMNMPASVNVLTGSGMSFMIGRVSYTYGFQGMAARGV
jgi:acyl transferase domain-containing protein